MQLLQWWQQQWTLNLWTVSFFWYFIYSIKLCKGNLILLFTLQKKLNFHNKNQAASRWSFFYALCYIQHLHIFFFHLLFALRHRLENYFVFLLPLLLAAFSMVHFTICFIPHWWIYIFFAFFGYVSLVLFFLYFNHRMNKKINHKPQQF